VVSLGALYQARKRSEAHEAEGKDVYSVSNLRHRLQRKEMTAILINEKISSVNNLEISDSDEGLQALNY
jgi:hypothetical protein